METTPAQLQHIFSSLSVLDTTDLDKVMDQVLMLKRQKSPSVLPERETELLRKINKTVPAVIQKFYDSLRAKLQNEELTVQEHEELIELTAYMENLQFERTAYLIELAEIRKISLAELIEELELKPKVDVV